MKSIIKENIKHGTKEFPLAVYTIETTEDMKIVQYFHWHDEYELFFIEKGGTTFNTDNKVVKIYENNLVFINRNAIHGAYKLDDLPCHFTAIVFRSDIIECKNLAIVKNFLNELFSDNQLSSLYFTTPSDTLNSIIIDIQEIKTYYNKKFPGYEMLIISKLMDIVANIVMTNKKNVIEDNTNIENSKFVKKNIIYFQDNFSKMILIEAMAKNNNMSKGYFERTFKKNFKMTPFEYLIHFRIIKSLQLLTDTDKSISEISYATGFNSFSYFSKCFKKIINKTPREYKKAIKR